MSVPSSMRVGPFTATVLVRKRYLLFYFFIIWVSTIAALIEFIIYWYILFDVDPYLYLFYLPLLFFLIYVTLVLVSLAVAKILLGIVSSIHKPREGVFQRDISDKDYRYWSIRNTIKRWPVWLAHKFPFPFLDNLCFKAFGVKTKFSNSLFEGWVDTEFIECGDNVVVGQGTTVQSTAIVGNLFIIRKTIIEDNVRIGAHSFVMPGTHIGKNSVLAANSVTTIGQVLKDNWIYVGIPAKEFKENRFFDDGLEDVLGKVEDMGELSKRYKDLYISRRDQEVSSK